MKQTDIAMLILIVSFSLLFSYFIGNAIFGGEGTRSTTVPTVESISSDFPEVDPVVFNSSSVNLTETINIGDSETVNPFTSDD